MRFTLTVAAAVMAFASSVIAQTAGFIPVTVPTSNEEVDAGSDFEIQWTVPAAYADGTVSLHLIGGESQGTQVPLADIAGRSPCG